LYNQERFSPELFNLIDSSKYVGQFRDGHQDGFGIYYYEADNERLRYHIRVARRYLLGTKYQTGGIYTN
jgi:hypothetical protein